MRTERSTRLHWLLWRSLRLPERNDQAEPAARVPTALVVMLRHFRRDVSLHSDRTKIVAQQTADGDLALLLIIDHRTREVGGAVGHRSKLPLVEFLGRGQIDIDEIRVAALQPEGRRARRDLRLVGDALKLDAVDDIGGQVPAAARIAQREPLIE